MESYVTVDLLFGTEKKALVLQSQKLCSIFFYKFTIHDLQSHLW